MYVTKFLTRALDYIYIHTSGFVFLLTGLVKLTGQLFFCFLNFKAKKKLDFD